MLRAKVEAAQRRLRQIPRNCFKTSSECDAPSDISISQGISEQIFNVGQISRFNVATYVCFIDYTKAIRR